MAQPASIQEEPRHRSLGVVRQVEHLVIGIIGVIFDAIEPERLGVLPPLWSSAAMKPFP